MKTYQDDLNERIAKLWASLAQQEKGSASWKLIRSSLATLLKESMALTYAQTVEPFSQVETA